MEIEIDDLATRLLALQQPMATDLRFITAAIKINNDLERMGDLAVNIVERALSLMQRAADEAPHRHPADGQPCPVDDPQKSRRLCEEGRGACPQRAGF